VALRASTASCAETYEKGLASFLGEARLLASFDHPALVKVHRFWRGNGTAYMAMPYYAGQTLKDVRLQMLETPREQWLHGLIAPLLGALELLHAHDVFHRDVAPDNILVLPDGRPVLLDFGCARRAVATGSQWFTAHLKPQFAPLEQYAAGDDGVGEGPWTDLYALGATLYFVVTGRAPVPSVARAARDTLPALSASALSPPAATARLSRRLLATIDWCLALAPHDRPQDVATVRRALLGEIVPPRPSPRFTADAGAAAAGEAAPAASAPHGGTSRGEIVAAAPPRPRRARRPGASLWLAFAGLATVGWGTFALQGTMPATASMPEETLALPELIEMPLPSRTPKIAPAAVAATAAVLASEPAPAAPRGSAGGRDTERVSTRLAEMPATPDRAGVAREGEKPARAQKRTAARTGKSSERVVRGACSADPAGMLTTALCVLNPCRDPKGRTSAQCADRQRAEEERLRRMASAG
jgi:hypothetical protein